MDFNYIPYPQRTYFIDGVPAKISGEWPGIKSNHWRGSIRILRPSHSRNIFDIGTTFPKILGKRRIELKKSEENELLSRKKLARNFSYLTDRPRGLRTVNIKNQEVRTEFRKKQIIPNYSEKDVQNHKKTFEVEDNIKNNNFKELTVEAQFGKKKKIWSLEEKRNGMTVRSPGDKIYKTCEFVPNFFIEGGLIPGSTNTINHNKTSNIRTNNFYETLDVKHSYLNQNKLWKNKVKNEEFKNENDYVKGLGQWENNYIGTKINKA